MMSNREIDAVLAENVMDWVLRREDDETDQEFDAWPGMAHWKPTDDISAAMEALEKVLEAGPGGGEVEITWQHGEWAVQVGYHGTEGICSNGYAKGKELPEAISRAILKAVGVEL